MSEELIYQERSLFPHNDFTTELFNEDFIDTVQNEKLAKALRRLTDRQKQAIKLAFWEGYQYKENGEEYMIRECMFCPKPHYNKSDNLYKLCEFRVWVHVQVH